MTPRLDLRDGNVFTVSPTQLASMQTCRAMWGMNYMHRRVRAGSFPARDGGSAFDRAVNLRYWQAGSAPVEAGSAVEDSMLRAIDAAWRGVEVPEGEYRTPARYKEVVRAYNAHWGREPFEVLGVQAPLRAALGTVPVPQGTSFDGGTTLFDHDSVRVDIHGLLDLLVRWDDGGVWVVDTKTMARWGSVATTSFENSGQALAYAWMAQQVHGVPVAGVLLNAVVIREPVKTKRRNGDPDNEFHRQRFFYAQERLAEWRADALREVEITLDCVARGHLPHNTRNCASQYGRACQFIDVCTSPASQRALVLSTDAFKDYERGPLGAPGIGIPEVPPAMAAAEETSV